ncbi:MAG: DUF2294 family protein [Chitinivibrionales bacterium]|nr:DUF2294 family protein [Chitinivibrionales bacterium]
MLPRDSVAAVLRDGRAGCRLITASEESRLSAFFLPGAGKYLHSYQGSAMIHNSEDVFIRIAKAVRSYCIEQMGIRPMDISVDIHKHSVTITLEGVSHPAEKIMARERLSRVKIEKMYLELFRVSKSVLHARLENVLGCNVERSFFAVEAEYGNAVIVLFLSETGQYLEKMPIK